MPERDEDRNAEVERVLQEANRLAMRMGYNLVRDPAKLSHFVGDSGPARTPERAIRASDQGDLVTTTPQAEKAQDGTAGTSATGNHTLTMVPAPSSLSIRSWPRWRLTMCRTIASPSPVPPTARDRPLSTR